MYVVYDKNNKINNNSLMFSTIVKDKDGTDKWVTFVRNEYINRFKKNIKHVLFPIYHELGHFINGDLRKENLLKSNILSSARKESIAKGKVLECELLADEFALKHLSKNIAINELEYSIQCRKKIDNNPLAIKELELRKKHIINLK